MRDPCAVADGFFLLGHVNDAAAAFADFLQEFVETCLGADESHVVVLAYGTS
jgi:hypothetical protein